MPDYNDDELEFLLDVNMRAVRALSCDELRQWLEVMANDADPYNLPQFIWFGHLFSEFDRKRRYPTAHPETKRIFNEFAQAKLALC